MKRKKQRNILRASKLWLIAAMILFVEGASFTAYADTDTFCKSETVDATDDVATCSGINVNNVESLGVTFNNMGATISEENNQNIGTEDYAIISGTPLGEKAACVLEFTKPIDASKLEYLTLGIYAGKDTKLRVYNSQVDNFIEDTASDVFTFATYGVEEKTLVLSKYADEDGYVRNITLYIADLPENRTLIVDYFTFKEYEETSDDFIVSAGTGIAPIETNLGENQVPLFRLNDKNVLNQLGWDNAVYIDGAEERVLKPGRYVSLNFDQVNIDSYETIVIDFFAQTDAAFTMYAYSKDELHYNLANADQIITLKGGVNTQIVLDASKFADEYGYVSQVNLLLVRNSDGSKEGWQGFFGDIVFRQPREYANVYIYTEKVDGGYEKNKASFKIEGKVGETVSIKPYTAEELGLYGYEYYTDGKNILSGVLQDGKEVQLQLYYCLRNCEVTVINDGEKTISHVKYGTELDLMEFRKDNMLMNIVMDGLEAEDTAVKIYNDCTISITQTPGNYVTFMVDGEVIATRTYAPGENAVNEPLVPIKEGYVGTWEEYQLNGTDIIVNAVYTESVVAGGDGSSESNVIVNVANKMEELKNESVPLYVIAIIAGVALIAGIAVLLVILVNKKVIKIKKQYIFAGSAAVVTCCLIIGCIGIWNNASNVGNTGDVDEEDYKFVELYTSDEEKTINSKETITVNIDRELKDKSYIQIDVDTDVNLVGTIEYYNLEDSSQKNVEDFFLEGASEETFYQFLDSFRTNASGNFEKHLVCITLTNVSEKEGKVKVNKVAISDRTIDLTKPELYVENEYLKVGMDLLCGGALTYYECLPRDGQVLQEIIDADGNIKLGLNYGEREGATLLSESVNLINIYDKGREVQQSFYADVYEENGYIRGTYVNQNNRDWPYNPVQGGDQDDNSSQIIDYRVEENLLYVKTRAMDWGQHNSTTKSYMENWYSLNDDALIVKNRYIDWNGFTGEINKINCEMPAVYFAQAFNTYVAYDGAAPWTGEPLDRQSALGDWAVGAHMTNNPSEGWFAWVNEDDYGISMYVPGMYAFASGRSNPSTSAELSLNSNAFKSSMLTDYRPKNTSNYSQCYVVNTSYTAPIIQTAMDQYVPLEYSYVIRMGFVDDIRSGYQTMDLNKVIDNSGLKAWD